MFVPIYARGGRAIWRAVKQALRRPVAVADCRAVPADAPVPVAAAVAIEMPVIGERARSVEDAAVDDAMDALFRRGLIPANEPRS